MAKYLRMPRTDAVVAAPLPISNKKRRFTPANGDAAVKNQKQKLAADAATGLSESERSMEEFEMLNKIGEGAYGVVFRARDTKTSEIVAVKKVKKGKELAETNILSRLNHPSIVDLKHCISSVYLVMEYAENEVRSLLETMKLPFSQSEVKCLMQQLLQGVAYLHSNQVIHRDLKTSNLLLNNRGELKICDFGMACRVTNIDDCIVHTDTVVTLWYRAPELLLGAKEYSAAIDMWAVGCIMAELLSRQILFDGVKETDQLGKIFKVLGSPSDAIWPGFSNLPGVGVGGRVKGVVNCGRSERSLLRQRFPAVCFTGSAVLLSNAGFDLLSRLLSYDPRRRITAEEALDHAWFREVPLPKSKDFMPTFPPNYARTRRDLVLHQQLSATGIGLFGL